MRIAIEDAGAAWITGIIAQSVTAMGLEAYLVGGFLRDAVLGRECKDIDILVLDDGGAKALAHHLHTRRGFYPPILFRTFGTYRTLFAGWEIEIVPPRGETLEEDLLHRDFTINTLTARLGPNPERDRSMEIEDRLGRAREDLERRIIRTPLDPGAALAEDPLRAVRAARFSAALSFAVDEGLARAVRKAAPMIRDVAVERIRDEIQKIMLLTPPSGGMRLLQALGLLEHIAPEITPAVGYPQNSPYHHQDVFEHCLTTMDLCEPDLVLRLSGLFHDIGKVEADKVVEGRHVYYGHQRISAEKARSFLTRLRFPHEVRDAVVSLVDNHMVSYTEEWKDSTVKRFMRKMGPRWERLLKLVKADLGALRPDLAAAGAAGHMMNFEALLHRSQAMRLDEVQSLSSPLDGNDIQEILGIPPGPLVGQVKEAVVNAILDGKIPDTKEAARELIMNTFVPLTHASPTKGEG